MVGMLHGMSHSGETEPEPRWMIETLLILALESEHHTELIDEMIELMPDPEQSGWAAPLTSHARSTKARGKELTLELLDVLEDIIQKRKEQLS
jgi:hypothetical protein